MKATYLTAAGALALTASLASCVSGPDVPLPPASSSPSPAPEAVATGAPAPAPTPTPSPTPTPTPAPAMEEPVYDNYLDAPRTPGTWTFIDEPAIRPGQPARSVAVYGPADTGPQTGEPVFMMVCDIASQRIGLSMKGDPSRPLAMTITTETVTRELAASSFDGSTMVSAILPASDPLLDAMAITKGRFAVALEGERTLYLPAWVEVSRVIEDCR